ncbi:hypothetical protein N656DRAFT_764485 [Canariomyces notabilis]|uniref:Borealin N-terminal domain-containing protein n=1 Tax=Canariomyces notabilis TaxID=2074819 RepID=A0AAN6TMN0_9PEZI|nr:hypothetical protein N656DRAFT_764485 [Canariomyces arenarius]
MYTEERTAIDMASQKVPTKGGDQDSPIRRKKMGITLAQKQALIDNLQLELTERARKLRANYNIHAQSLRTRIEIRVNRIPVSLRKLKMGDLLQKYSTEQQQKPNAATSTAKGPPVPAKDSVSSRSAMQRTPAAALQSSTRPAKRLSHEISGGDKENDLENMENPKKKARGNPASDITRYPGHVLSPTTSNSRVLPRDRTVATPGRSGIARPAMTPGRTAAVATNILNNMVEKARSTRAAATGRKTTALTTTTTTSISTTNGAGTAAAVAARRKRGATVTAAVQPAAPPSRPATRTARRVSGTSESSEGSTSTVVRKRPATAPPGAQPKPFAPPPPTSKRTMGATIRKGVGAANTTRKPPASRSLAASVPPSGTGGTGRVLRKRA